MKLSRLLSFAFFLIVPGLALAAAAPAVCVLEDVEAINTRDSTTLVLQTDSS